MRAFTVVVGLSLLVGTADAQELRAYPDRMLTPGSINPSLTPEYICSHSTSERRSVTTALKKSVFAAYNVPFEDRANYEVDHFIPLALGGGEYLYRQPDLQFVARAASEVVPRNCALGIGNEGPA
jgi:hypothetical protein